MMPYKKHSLFEIDSAHTFTRWRIPDSTPAEEFFLSGEYQYTEEAILRALYEYRFLNRKNIERILRRDVKKHLEKMVLQGMVEEDVLVDAFGKRVEPSVVAYLLSEKAYRYFVDNRDYQRGYRYQDPVTDMELLKILSVNQYHIGMATKNKDLIIKATVNDTRQYREMGTVVIPSYIELKGDLKIFAFPMFRKNEEYTAQIRSLVKLSGYLTEEKITHPLLVFTAPSNQHAIEGMKKIHKVRELSNLPLTYVLDYNSLGNPIHHIIRAEIEEEKVILGQAEI